MPLPGHSDTSNVNPYLVVRVLVELRFRNPITRRNDEANSGLRIYDTHVCLAMLTAACSTKNVVTEQPVESSIGIVEEYKLGIGDAVEVNVWRNPDLSVSVMVRPDGKISVPLAGDVEVDGVSTAELSKIIEERLSSYIRNNIMPSPA